MTENVFTPHTEPQAEPTLRRNLELPKGVLQKNLKTFVYLGAASLVIVAALFSSSGKKTPAQQAAAKGQPPQPTLQDNTDSNVQELKNQLQAERQKEQQAQWPPLQSEIRRLRLRRHSSGLQPRPMDRPALPCPVFRASPARKRSRATCRCNSRLCNSRHS
jgi:hypothetical protein